MSRYTWQSEKQYQTNYQPFRGQLYYDNLINVCNIGTAPRSEAVYSESCSKGLYLIIFTLCVLSDLCERQKIQHYGPF